MAASFTLMTHAIHEPQFVKPITADQSLQSNVHIGTWAINVDAVRLGFRRGIAYRPQHLDMRCRIAGEALDSKWKRGQSRQCAGRTSTQIRDRVSRSGFYRDLSIPVGSDRLRAEHLPGLREQSNRIARDIDHAASAGEEGIRKLVMVVY
jgi:hypothetical protein